MKQHTHKSIRIIAIALMIVLAIATLSGCRTYSDEELLIGTWNFNADRSDKTLSALVIQRIEFYEDGTGLLGTYDMTWELEEGKLKIKYLGMTSTHDFEVSKKSFDIVNANGAIGRYDREK